MGDKPQTRQGPAAVRNVALAGHCGSGKTTLVEALALTAGAVERAGRVEDGTTVSDHDGIEHRGKRSVQLSLVPLDWAGHRINLLDTPGYPEFVGELRAGLRAADAALFVVSAAQEPETVAAATRALWQECAAVGMPRAIVVTHLDTARTGFDEMTRLCARLFGGDDPDAVLPLYLPVLGARGPDGHAPATGLAGLLSGQVFDYSSGGRTGRPPGPDQRPGIEEARGRLIEGIIAESEDETLMDRYLAGDEIDSSTLVQDLEKAVARGTFHPVLAAAPAPPGARQGLGTVELLDLITGGFPGPRERKAPAVTTPLGAPRPGITCDPGGPLVAEVMRTDSDPYVGRVSLVRVFSGTLRPDETVHVSGHGLADRGHEEHDAEIRVGALSSPFGARQRVLSECAAGDLACVARLSCAETGDTLSDPDDPLLMVPWAMPDPLLPLAVRAHAASDEDKLSQGLSRLAAEDPTLRLERNQDTGQVVLWCLGEAHQDVALERLRGRYGVNVDPEPYEVALRETFADSATGRGRHVKQSGGHGQFAICEIEVDPLPPGSGVEFVDKVVGGAVPRQFVASVEKGVRAQAARGVGDGAGTGTGAGSGRPLVDIRVTLVDGKAHSVDSSDGAFQTAGALALREAAAGAVVRLLEPVAEIRVTVPDAYVGPVMSDLSGRRGRVVGTEQAGAGETLIRAEVPELEIERYAVDLRSVSHGTGRFGRSYAGHETVPPATAGKLREHGLFRT